MVREEVEETWSTRLVATRSMIFVSGLRTTKTR